jgi:predicted MPP superfamily phosphohydrolase
MTAIKNTFYLILAMFILRRVNQTKQIGSEEAPAMVSTKLNSLADDESSYTILLSHRPELFESYAHCNIDLVLSGHTHGGQFRLPFIGWLIAPDQGIFPKYDAGLFTNGSTNMIVSRGLGNSIIPIRFNNRPEVIVIELLNTDL